MQRKKIITHPAKVNLPMAAIDIDMNSYNSAALICAVLSDNTIWCWGDDIQGQSGSVIKTPQQLTGFSPVSKVETGFRHLCALTTDQRIQCIGEVGRLLGRGTSTASYTPDYVTGITTATDISVGYADTCALLQDQTVRCWGDNNHGQLGVGDTTGRSSPVDPGLSNITQISSGSISSCAVNTSNELYCWGLNSGTLLDTDTSSRTPVQMTQLSNVQSVSVGGRLFNMAGTSVTCAVDNLDKLSCWGEATYGSAGEDRTLYNELQINSDFTDLGIKQVFAFGEMHPIVCVIPKAPYKGLYCRGRILAATEANNWEHIKEVRRVDNLPQKTNWSFIGGGETSVCAQDSNQQTYCWGYNLNWNDTNDRNPKAPSYDSSLDGAKSITHRCLVEENGSFSCLSGGAGGASALSGTQAEKISGISDFNAYIDSSGSIKSWGYNFSGQFGTGNTTHANDGINTATMLTIANAVDVVAGWDHTCVLTQDKKLYCAGETIDGVLNSNNTSPVQVTGIGDVKAVASGSDHVCAINFEDKLYCWGANDVGQIGQASGVTATGSPTLVSEDVIYVAAHLDKTCFIKSDHSLYCSGKNSDSYLFSDTSDDIFLPRKVDTDKKPTSLFLTTASQCFTAKDGYIYCWGSNLKGQSGLDLTNFFGRFSPIFKQ